jgi:hypothetical protein
MSFEDAWRGFGRQRFEQEREMATFEVHGPFKIDFEKRKGGRTLVFDNFWSKNGDASYLSLQRGCYVFAIRNRGLTPIYVGKAETPIIYFVVHPAQKGPTNIKQIRDIEDFLIQAGTAKNPDLQNIKGAQQPLWCIKGVVRSGAGKPNEAEIQLRTLFGINA